MAKAGKKHSTPDARPPEANPHFIGRFTPTRLTASPLYRTQHDSCEETMTLAEKRQYRHLQGRAARSGLGETPPPSSRGRKKPDKDISRLEQYVHDAEHGGLSRTEAVRRWVRAANKGKQLSEKTLRSLVADLMRKMRQRARARLMPPQPS
jgi:hypothetical protein